jgi:hypothetical protein
MFNAAIQTLLNGDFNAIGLVLGFVGGLLLFFFGLPPLGVLNDGAYVEIAMTPKMRLYIRLSQLGLALIALGFACQFLALRPA